MSLPRRQFVLSLPAAALVACGPTPPDRPPTTQPAPKIERANVPGFDAWVAQFRTRATARGITPDTLNAAFQDVAYLPGVITRDGSQFQTRRTVEDYIALATSDDRIREGRAMLQRHGATLAAIAARYGVPAELLTALWGVESRYGTRRGDFPVISALATLGFASRRASFFEGQLIGALRVLQRGDTTAARMTGSWAGAMGHTQFIPTTFLSYGVDFNGDGRRDIWGDDPTDALASAANYLSRSGWKAGQRWGYEVSLPRGSSAATKFQSGTTRGFASWRSGGLRGLGAELPTTGNGTLFRPGNTTGPAILATGNFRALLRYNNSDSYAVAVGHLSDRLAGRGAFQTPFGRDKFGLSLGERKDIQSRLAANGYEIGTVDGVFGSKTEAAIRAFQKSEGLPVTGIASPDLLGQLR